MTVAAYLRASTEEQVDDHQRDSITAWADANDTTIDEWFVDIGSGAKDDREQFTDLLDDLEAGAFETVVVWEMSRLSRSGETLQRVLNLLEETDTTLAITDGRIDEVRPDGTGRFVADIVGMVYQQERRTLIQRTNAGMKRARKEGKWIGAVPKGFRRDEDGYLQPVLDADREAGEVSFLEMQDALERVDAGESYRSVAKGLPINRTALSKIHKDDDRVRWYLEGEADDERVAAALETWNANSRYKSEAD